LSANKCVYRQLLKTPAFRWAFHADWLKHWFPFSDGFNYNKYRYCSEKINQYFAMFK